MMNNVFPYLLDCVVQGLDLETSAYHAAMFACTKESPARWTECLDLLREMKSKGLPVGVRKQLIETVAIFIL